MAQPSSASVPHRSPWRATIVLAVVFAGASLAGLIWTDTLYTDLDMQLTFLPLDLLNLLVITPQAIVLLAAIRQGRSMALAAWSGYTLYTLYTSILHLWAMPLSPAMAAWTTVVVGSAILTCASLLTVDNERLRRRLGLRLHARFCGGVLVVLGVVFGSWALGEMLCAGLTDAPTTRLDSMLWLADLSIAPVCAVAGVALWRRQPVGFVLGPGGLVMFSALFLGLVPIEGFRALTTTASMSWTTVATALVFGGLSLGALLKRPRQDDTAPPATFGRSEP